MGVILLLEAAVVLPKTAAPILQVFLINLTLVIAQDNCLRIGILKLHPDVRSALLSLFLFLDEHEGRVDDFLRSAECAGR